MKKPVTFIVTTLIAVIVVGGAFMFLQDMDGPSIVMQPDTGSISPSKEVTLHLADAVSGVRSVNVSIQRDGKSTTVFEKFFASKPKETTVAFSMKNSGVRDGEVHMIIKVIDGSLSGFGSGNSTVRAMYLNVDGVVPRITVLSPPGASGRKGSVAAVSYALSEDVAETGIRVNGEYFKAYKQGSGVYFCLFGFPLEMKPNEFIPTITATDLAGNEGTSRLLLPAQDRAYPTDTLTIGDGFLDSKMPAFAADVPEAQTNLERYVQVNNVVRIANEKTLREVAKKTAPTLLWEGSFMRLPRSAQRANFGDYRTYKYNGEVIDHQTHMGLDLASVKHAPIPAANTGKVVFADELGIFGKLVIVDHGLGLMTLYSHMSSIHVTEGMAVATGDTLGETGVTGLAGGDHLHFGVLINGIQIHPIDWFDKNWIKNNITDRLVQQ